MGRGLQIVFLAFVLGVIGYSHGHLASAPRSAAGPGVLPDANTARIASLGFDALVADLYWFQAVQIAGAGTKGQSHRIGALVDLVTELDPWVDHPYRFAALWMDDDLEAVRKANRLLRRGIEHHPDEWRNRFYLAFNHFFYLGEQTPAAEALEPAIGLPKAPRYLGRLVARLKSESGGLETSAAFLQELANNAPDEYTRSGYEIGLLEIETERRARFLDQARERFEAREGRALARVEELVELSPPILSELPPEPQGAGWTINDMDQIASAKLRYRYRAKIDGTSRGVIQAIRDRSDEKKGAAGHGTTEKEEKSE